MDETTDRVKMVESGPRVSKVVAFTSGQSVTHADRSRVLIRKAKPGLGSSEFLGDPRLATLGKIQGFLDVNTDQQNKGLEAWLTR